MSARGKKAGSMRIYDEKMLRGWRRFQDLRTGQFQGGVLVDYGSPRSSRFENIWKQLNFYGNATEASNNKNI